MGTYEKLIVIVSRIIHHFCFNEHYVKSNLVLDQYYLMFEWLKIDFFKSQVLILFYLLTVISMS
jgi:hypothetical protein